MRPTGRVIWRLPAHINAINAIHPFREGNGRTQRLYLEVLAKQAGHELAMDRIDPKAWNDASVAGMSDNHQPMKLVLLGMIYEREDKRDTALGKAFTAADRQEQERGPQELDIGRERE